MTTTKPKKTYEEGYEEGYSQGYLDGCKTAMYHELGRKDFHDAVLHDKESQDK